MELHLQQTDAESFTIPGGTEGVLYPTDPNGDQSIARVALDGRYPETGFSINDKNTETLYVLEGKYTMQYGEDILTLEPGDIFYIMPGTKYSLEGKGESLVFITPVWDSEQNHIIEQD